MWKILLNIKKGINQILLILYREKINWRLRKNKNSFNSSNYFYGGNNVCIINTKWGKHSGIGGYAEIMDTLVGNPAKFIKWRFPLEVREKLLEIKWWDWDDGLIKEKKDYLQNLVGFDMDRYKTEYRKRKEDLFY